MPNEDSGVRTLIQDFHAISEKVIKIETDICYIRNSLEKMENIPEALQNLNYIVKGANGSDGLTKRIEAVNLNLEFLKKKVSEFDEFKRRIYWIGGLLMALSGGLGGLVHKIIEAFG